jgi:signal transduction histidine kinase
VPGEQADQSVFGGQVFLLRHVQIEDKHFLQGFRLNEEKLIEEVDESASRLMRKGMSFELAGAAEAGASNNNVAYAAILDFGFGDLVLNLKEIDPDWIRKQIDHLRLWYFSTVAVVLFAVALALVSLWSNATAQIRLARKKDDFISAVSHELRTPLTSIRMYAEMLEKQSERLSRLVENVLDFSRIQRGRKKYAFNVGDINQCVEHVVEMMAPWAGQRGFSIQTELGTIAPSAFDGDAVTQIVVNLLDNAIKYARNAEDKTITVRTRSDDRFILIEVEDHGPGVPARQRNKIFEAFYRCGAEATRETTGTGLGLALVKKFVEAHEGFVEIVNVRPTGAIFRVGLLARSL